MPTIPLDPDAPGETDAIWSCPVCGLESASNTYDGHTLYLRCANDHEWTWDGTWLTWDVPGRGEQE